MRIRVAVGVVVVLGPRRKRRWLGIDVRGGGEDPVRIEPRPAGGLDRRRDVPGALRVDPRRVIHVAVDDEGGGLRVRPPPEAYQAGGRRLEERSLGGIDDVLGGTGIEVLRRGPESN